MLGEFLARLAIALPLICALAVLLIWAARKGWFRLPAIAISDRAPAGQRLLEVLEVRAVSPVARLAVVRFDGRTHLLGVTGQAISLLSHVEEAADEAVTEVAR